MHDSSSSLWLEKGGCGSFFLSGENQERGFGFVVSCASDAPMPLQSQNRKPKPVMASCAKGLIWGKMLFDKIGKEGVTR